MTKNENAVVTLDNASLDYTAAAIYAVYGKSAEIVLVDVIEDEGENSFCVTLPPYCAPMVVISDDISDFPTVIN